MVIPVKQMDVPLFKNSKDGRIISQQYILGTFLGWLPPICGNKFRKAICYSATLLWTFAFTWFEIMGLTKRLKLKTNANQYVFRLVDATHGIVELFFGMVCFHSAFFRSEKWKRLLEELASLENTEACLWLQKDLINPSTYVLIILLCLVCQILINVWDIYCYDVVASYYTGNRILKLINLFMVTLLYLILTMIYKRYKFIQMLVKDTAMMHVCSKEMIRNTFEQIEKHYCRTYQLAGKFNELFGWVSFLIVTNACLTVLAYTTWSYQEKFGRFKGEKILMAFAESIFILGYTTVLITSCDRIIKTKEQITLLCYLQQAETTDCHLIEELKNFALLTENLLPRFLAGELFEINQNFFSGFLMSVASYCIICIQFNVNK